MKPFKFNQGKMLFHRVGPMSGQVQTHKDGNVAPVRKGAWFFPYPYFDYFFAFQTYERFMPPKLVSKNRDSFETEEDWEAHLDWLKEEGFAARETWLKEKGSLIPQTRKRPYWWGGVVYSKLWDKRYGRPHDDNWFIYETPKEFAQAAQKTLASYSTWDGWREPTKIVAGSGLSIDHLEVFLPIT